MKKYLFIALAALGFAACSEKEESGNQPAQNAELEQSYVAVTFTADGVTRADNYEAGSPEERAVKSAYVFFFDEQGNAFAVDNMQAHSGDINYVDVLDQLSKKGEAMDNVSDVQNAVLVLKNYKGQYPAQVVAVLNWQPTKNSYSLAELDAEVSELGNDANGYVMSNSVYLNANGEIVKAVALTSQNIAKTKEMAIANPITIHVERVAAKVEFKSDSDGIFEVGEVEKIDTPADDMTTVYARIEGFELYNDYEQSWLMKDVEESWGLLDTVLGFNWNEVSRFRSFWATSLNGQFPANEFAWNTESTQIGGYVYCGENTRAWTAANDVRTKVIVKATLVEKVGDEYKPIEIVNWWGMDYVTEDHLKVVVANTLVNTYFVKNGNEYIGLTPADIKCVARDVNDTNAYEVYFQLSDAGVAKSWYKYEGGNYTTITPDALNTALAAVQPALVYKNGMTYYWLDIKHLGDTGSIAEYGVVRNHIYKVNITDIEGFGTPVYNGATDFIRPEKPVDIDTFVAAQINILSWRVVENDYNLE